MGDIRLSWIPGKVFHSWTELMEEADKDPYLYWEFHSFWSFLMRWVKAGEMTRLEALQRENLYQFEAMVPWQCEAAARANALRPAAELPPVPLVADVECINDPCRLHWTFYAEAVRCLWLTPLEAAQAYYDGVMFDLLTVIRRVADNERYLEQ